MHHTYSYSDDFNSKMKIFQFRREVKSNGTLPTLKNIHKKKDHVTIYFDEVLTSGQETTLDSLVSSHSTEGGPSANVDAQNLCCLTTPAEDHDITKNYTTGTLWVDTITDKGYICVDSATGAAIWDNITTKIDSQLASSISETTTTSTTWTDLTDMTITSSNSAATNYLVNFSTTVENNTGTEQINIILNVDGSDVSSTERFLIPSSADTPMVISTNHLAENIINGKIIKVRWKTTGGTAKAHQRTLTCYGLN